ncbi:sugar transferase [Oscillibacter valericigenes]|uniref:sugar transferase n=1 Tax=Oscillibacter valericigenes TaxID=351091 RepID=UPI001F1E44EF|nr:sugar transferase [Oscillibacter valericigenes]MCF2617871.1 sugar transferase [Oscillibacter valericigenes]
MRHPNKGRATLLHFVKGLLVLSQAGLFLLSWMVYYRYQASYSFYFWGYCAIAALYLAMYTAFAQLYGGFHTTVSRTGEIAYSLGIAAVLTDGMFYCILCLLSYKLVNPVPLVVLMAANVLLSTMWAWVAVRLTDWLYPPLDTYLIYENEDAYISTQGLRELTWKFRIVREIRLEQEMEIDGSLLYGAEAVILCGLPSSTRNTLLKMCVARDLPAYIRPKIGDLLLSGANRVHLAGLPFLYTQAAQPSIWYRAAKRGMDIAFSSVFLVLLSPLFALIALAVKLDDGGPVFYRQRRLTIHGREFEILKFRSMRTDAEKDGVARLSTGDRDDRVTRVGHILRKCRLDELPQLWNILRGEMSIVGPRPERPEIAAQYEAVISEFRLRLQVKAGLTGYAQVYGKYNTDSYDKLEMDLMYIARQSIVQDIALMFATVKTLFLSESTEGVAEGQTTASRVADEKEKFTRV